MELLRLDGIYANADNSEILHGIDLKINSNEIHVLMGPNGAGKSTIGNIIMGNPSYEITSGKIIFDGQDITQTDASERAKAGIFMSFQEPVSIPGLTMERFLLASLEAVSGKKIRYSEYKKALIHALSVLSMDEAFVHRDLNVGFSGGEKKKAEILTLLMLKPKLAILDETDSGLDVDAVRAVGKGIESYISDQNGTLLIVTHSTRILENLKVDRTHVCVKGKIITSGDSTLVDSINKGGYEIYEK